MSLKVSHLTHTCSYRDGSLQHSPACKPSCTYSAASCTACAKHKQHACSCRVTTAGTNARSQNAQVLYDRWVLDVPKLLDLAAIYGPDNAKLLQQLLQQVSACLLACSTRCTCIAVPLHAVHGIQCTTHDFQCTVCTCSSLPRHVQLHSVQSVVQMQRSVCCAWVLQHVTCTQKPEPAWCNTQVFKVQPQYGRDLWDTGPTLTSNLQDVQQTCQQASDGMKTDTMNGRLLTGLSGMVNTTLLCLFFLKAFK